MLTRWKILACSLTVGVGGLAVFADPPADNKKAPLPEPPPLPKLTVKPDSPGNGTDTPAPPAGAKPSPGLEFDLDLPTIPLPAKPSEPKLPDLPKVSDPVPPPVFLPVKGETDAPTSPPKKVEPKPAPKPELSIPLPPLPDDKVPVTPPPPAVKPLELTPIPGPGPTTNTPVAEPEPTRIAPPALSPPPAPKGVSTRLKMLLRVGDGNPRFEIRNAATTELLLKVYGDKIEFQTPAASKSTMAGVSATGKVRFTAPGIEGHCDSLKILSATGDVLLEGNIRLKSRGGKPWSELTAEKMVYQIGNTGLVAPKSPVKPAAFLPEK